MKKQVLNRIICKISAILIPNISNSKKALLLFLPLAFLTSCKKDSIQSQKSPPIGKDEVIVVSRDSLRNSLLAVDTGTLTFNSGGVGASKLKPGIILVSDTSRLAPFGFMRKITSISNTTGGIVCHTVSVPLPEVIPNAAVSFQKVYDTKDIFSPRRSFAISDPKLQTESTISNSQTFTFSHTFDTDGNPKTTNDQVDITGGLQLNASLNFDLIIKNGSVQKASVEAILQKTVSLNATTNLSSKSFSGDVPLGTYNLTPITVYIGVIPVVITTRLVFTLGAEGNLSAAITTGAANTDVSDVGIVFQNNTWSNINLQTNKFSFQPPTLNIVGNIEAYLQAKYELAPYGLYGDGFNLIAKGYVSANASKIGTSAIAASLAWGVDFSGSAQFNLAGHTVLQYNNTFYEKEFPIWSHSTPIITLPSVTTTAISAVMATTATSGGNVTNDGGAPITSRGVCWSPVLNPTTSANKTSDGSGKSAFTSSISGLLPNTTYHVRAYAINSAGTAYGNDVSFTTAPKAVGVLQVTGTLSFGNISTASMATQTLQLKNTGNAPINIYGISVSAPFSANYSSTTLGVSQTMPVLVNFKPIAAGFVSTTLTINSNASNNLVSISASGTGVQNGPIAVPAIGTFANCVTPGNNPIFRCAVYQDGTINARIISINTSTHQVTFEIKKCNGTAFNAGGNLNIVSDLCTGASYGYPVFYGGNSSYQFTINDSNMSGTKKYYLFIVQGASHNIFYDAPVLSVTY